jgi:hypothetical protein
MKSPIGTPGAGVELKIRLLSYISDRVSEGEKDQSAPKEQLQKKPMPVIIIIRLRI